MDLSIPLCMEKLYEVLGHERRLRKFVYVFSYLINTNLV